MIGIKINKVLLTSLFLLTVLTGGGCAAMVKELPPTAGLTKEKIIKSFPLDSRWGPQVFFRIKL